MIAAEAPWKLPFPPIWNIIAPQEHPVHGRAVAADDGVQAGVSAFDLTGEGFQAISSVPHVRMTGIDQSGARDTVQTLAYEVRVAVVPGVLADHVHVDEP